MAKKSMSQQAVSLVAPVMPAPVASVVTSRWGSRLFILVVPFLLATGVLTISWDNGVPTVNFDRARAWIVGKQVEQQAMRAVEEYEKLGPQTGGQTGGQTQGWGQPQTSQWQPQSSYPAQQQAAGQPYQQPSAQPSYPQQYRPQQYGMQPYGGQPYAPQQSSPQAYPQQYAPQQYAPQPYAPQQMAQPYGAPAYR